MKRKNLLKVVAVDLYGTILVTEDPENAMPIRAGFREFCLLCHQNKIKIVSSSDADLINQRIDLSDKGAFEYFDRLYRLKTNPKRYSAIIRDYSLSHQELLVIGNEEVKDLTIAKRIGCKTFLVPNYTLGNYFDFMDIWKTL